MEALSLTHSLRAQGQSPSEWLAVIAADQTLTEPVRQRALQFAREWKWPSSLRVRLAERAKGAVWFLRVVRANNVGEAFGFRHAER